MKNFYFILLLTLVISSCNKQEVTTDPNGESITFNLMAEDEVLVRSGNGLTRYIMEVYQGDDLSAKPIYEQEQESGTFTVSLDSKLGYICLFWADRGDVNDNANSTYDASSLKDVTLNSGEEMTEAFYTRYDMPAFISDSHSITLKRAMAQVNLIATDIIPANSELVTTSNAYSQFNVSSGEVSGTAAPLSRTINLSATTGKLATFLTFASVSGITSDFSFILSGSITNDVTNVPLKANYLTNITGKFSSQNYTFIVNADETWEGEINAPLNPSVLIEIPDAALKAYLVANFDTDGDNNISIQESLLVDTISYDGANYPVKIKSFVGIEHFPNLLFLSCRSNSLTSIDVTKNTKLVHLWCHLNSIQSLDVSKNTKLIWLYCQANSLPSLDISRNTELINLECHENPLATLTMKTGQSIRGTFNK